MRLHNLPKITQRKKKLLGRGPGSGKGKTSGRGMKGQKARYKVRPGFEGRQPRLTKRLPKLRGKGRLLPHKPKPKTIDIARLNIFRAGSRVTPEILVEKGLVKKIPPAGIKILAKGKLEKKLTLEGFKISKGAREQVEELGGKIKEISSD